MVYRRRSGFFSFAFLVGACLAPLTGAVLAGCTTEAVDEATAADEAELRALAANEIVGTIAFGQTSDPIAYASPPRYRALRFQGAAGDHVEAWIRSADGDAVAFLVDASFKSIARNDDADATTKDARLAAKLRSSGEHYVVFRERDLEPATFTVALAKVPAPPPVPGESCSAPNEIRARACGACGVQQILCLDENTPAPYQPGTWSEYGVCYGELAGGCIPGTVDSTSAGCLPGTSRHRTCTATCSWGLWSPTCTPDP